MSTVEGEKKKKMGKGGAKNKIKGNIKGLLTKENWQSVLHIYSMKETYYYFFSLMYFFYREVLIVSFL